MINYFVFDLLVTDFDVSLFPTSQDTTHRVVSQPPPKPANEVEQGGAHPFLPIVTPLPCPPPPATHICGKIAMATACVT